MFRELDLRLELANWHQNSTAVVSMLSKLAFKILGIAAMEQIAAPRSLQRNLIKSQIFLQTLPYARRQKHRKLESRSKVVSTPREWRLRPRRGIWPPKLANLGFV